MGQPIDHNCSGQRVKGQSRNASAVRTF